MGKDGGALRTILNIVLLVVVLAILGISIAVLVEVLNNNKNNNVVVPSPSKAVNELNVHAPLPIPSGSANFQGYQSAVQLFKTSLDTQVNPCDDFYKYTCGNFDGGMSFDQSDNSNIDNMVQQLTNQSYVNSAPGPVKQVAWYFQQCVAARMNWTSVVKSGKMVTDAINRVAAGAPTFENQTQFPFYMLNQKEPVKPFPDRVGLGYLFGYPAGGEGAPNLVTLVSIRIGRILMETMAMRSTSTSRQHWYRTLTT